MLNTKFMNDPDAAMGPRLPAPHGRRLIQPLAGHRTRPVCAPHHCVESGACHLG